MLKRTISGAVYVAIIVGFFLLRGIDAKFFDVFIWFLSFMGAFEVARAVKPYSLKGAYVCALIFGATFAPVYVATEYFLGGGCFLALDYLLLWSIALAIYSIVVKADLKLFVPTVLPIIYPAVLLLFMLIANGLSGEKGFLSLLLIFVISPCADVMAYLVGMTYSKIKKGNAKKLCPRLSPNKTVAGAIGGLIGGALGGIIVYFIFKGKADSLALTLPLLFFALAGFFGAAFTEAGDLFESFIKRKTGIKDMGKIMPGHGGVMDRIDGTSFLAVLICLMFLFV